MKRTLIYFIYDKHGIVDEYIYYVISKLKPFVENFIVVVNGELSNESNSKLLLLVDQVIIRPNVGFDVWAYKTGIETVGWDRLFEYDELVLMNFTIMGPVYDLDEMFSVMDAKKNLDFWGITKCFQENSPEALKLWGNPYGYIPEHIQSSFMAFRRNLFSSDVFKSLWDNMPMIHSYYESGGTYEQVITKKFADLGYHWDCYTDYSKLSKETYGCCPLITAPGVVVKDLKSPFFKRRSFFTSKFEYPSTTPSIRNFFDFLQRETNYDTDLVLNNLTRTCNQRDIVESLLLCHVVDENINEDKTVFEEFCSNLRIAIFVNLQNVVDVHGLQVLLKQYEPYCDIFTSDTGNTTVTSFFTGVRGTYEEYDYVLLIDPPKPYDNEVPHMYILKQEYYIFEFLKNINVLKSSIELMEDTAYVGLVCFPTDFLRAINWEQYEGWADYYHFVKSWMLKNDIKIPISVNQSPIEPFGIGVVKVKGIHGLASMQFSIFDSRFLHYVLPIICQNNGYLPQLITPQKVLINNFFGHDTYSNWIPEVFKVKQEYYSSLPKRVIDNDVHMETDYECIKAERDALLQSTSWKITSPLRKLRSFFVNK